MRDKYTVLQLNEIGVTTTLLLFQTFIQRYLQVSQQYFHIKNTTTGRFRLIHSSMKSNSKAATGK